MNLPGTAAEAVMLLAGIAVVASGLTARPRDSVLVAAGIGLLTTAATMGAKAAAGKKEGE